MSQALFKTLHELDSQVDINQVLNDFSYEHFYVLYCKFWELDTDRDFMLSEDDLRRYGNGTLCGRVIDRVMAGIGKPLT